MKELIGFSIGTAVLAILFWTLEALWPEDRTQPRWRKESGTNLLYWFFDYYIGRVVVGIGVIGAVVVTARFVPRLPNTITNAQPTWLQAVEIVLLGDLLGYWIHRVFHTVPHLWPFHAVHHSPQKMDWLAAARLHPLDSLVTRMIVVLPFYFLGFSANVLTAYVPFLAIYPILLHANLNWSYGPFRYIIASPAFHRWHHSAEWQALNKNYSGLFPWIDLLFGTAYFPRYSHPVQYGLYNEQIPRGILGQLAYPFGAMKLQKFGLIVVATLISGLVLVACSNITPTATQQAVSTSIPSVAATPSAMVTNLTGGTLIGATSMGGGSIGPNDLPDFIPALNQSGSDAATLQVKQLPTLFNVPGQSFAQAPTQPASGPGGADYSYRDVSWHLYGHAQNAYFIFEPTTPAADSAPVIVFLHGWLAINPIAYLDWLRHLVRKGNIVIYPLYQQVTSSGAVFTPSAVQGVKDALAELQTPGHVKPELEHFAIMGHSAGGVITANIAALAVSQGLPTPQAIMPIEPGGAAENGGTAGFKRLDLKSVPSSTYCLIMVGNDDTVVGYTGAKPIWDNLEQIPADHKDLVKIIGDKHGTPITFADHYMAGSDWQINIGFRRAPNPTDYYGTWKLADALFDTAFYGRDQAYALGNTAQQRFMGKWSDGTPITELLVTQNLADLGPDPYKS